MRRGHDKAVVAVDGANLAIHIIGQVAVDFGDFLIHQQAAFVRLHNHHFGFIVGKTQHLQSAGIVDQPCQPLGNELLGADGFGNVKHLQAAAAFFFIGLVFQIIHRAHARDAAGNVKHIRAQLAGHQIGFIAAGERQHQIGIGRTGALQHHGRRGIAVQRLHIELAAQIVQRRFVDIDNGHIVIGHAGQILRHGRADLAAAENEDFHV